MRSYNYDLKAGYLQLTASTVYSIGSVFPSFRFSEVNRKHIPAGHLLSDLPATIATTCNHRLDRCCSKKTRVLLGLEHIDPVCSLRNLISTQSWIEIADRV